jgi:hypothetical protein
MLADGGALPPWIWQTGPTLHVLPLAVADPVFLRVPDGDVFMVSVSPRRPRPALSLMDPCPPAAFPPLLLQTAVLDRAIPAAGRPQAVAAALAAAADRLGTAAIMASWEDGPEASSLCSLAVAFFFFFLHPFFHSLLTRGSLACPHSAPDAALVSWPGAAAAPRAADAPH